MHYTLLLTPLLDALSGLALGMLGGGSSILTVPILVDILRQDPPRRCRDIALI